jgi:3-hydroxybutyrate dehydrogenase
MLKSRVALVTGSTSGIGLGIARVLAAKGHHVMLHGLESASKHADLVEEMSKLGNGALTVAYCAADISQVDACRALVDHTLQHFGALDILVNNAGVQHVAPIESFPDEQLERVMRTNLFSHFYTFQRALPHMRQQGWGRLISIASTHGLVASANKSAYVAAKHGVVGLVKAIALETAGSGITCNAVCPGWVLTPLVQQQIEARAQTLQCSVAQAKDQLVSEKHPSRDFVTPEQIGELVAFIASDAGAQMTGSAVTMDGGWTCQ